MEAEPSGAVALINSLLYGKPKVTESFCAQFRALALHYYEDHALLVVSWDSLQGEVATIALRPATASARAVAYRYVRKKERRELDVYVQIRLSKAEMNDFAHDALAHLRPPAMPEAPSFAPLIVKAWKSCPELVARGMGDAWLDDLEVLARLTQQLIAACSLMPDAAIHLVLLVHANKPYDAIREQMRDRVAVDRASDALARLSIMQDSSRLADFVDANGTACVYSEQLIRVSEMPGGQGFSDMLPRRYYIEPFVAITTDSLERPIEALDPEEQALLRGLADGAPERRAVRRYYVLRRGTREAAPRETINEYVSFGCFATRLILFDARDEAEQAMQRMLGAIGRVQRTTSGLSRAPANGTGGSGGGT
jgi:hypothetical protein